MNILFLIADEIRQEVGGKQTILGLYADKTILLEGKDGPQDLPPGIPEGIDRIAFLINVSEATEGVHVCNAQIIDPSGQPHGPNIPLGEFTTEEGISRTLVVEAKPFIFSGKGTYSFNLSIDGILHSFPFKVIDKP
jgi:hypothetical protein